MLGAQCHAVRVRLTGPPVPEGTLAERLAAAGPWRLWVEDVPAGAAEPFAARRLDAEMRRPAAGVRCVLLRYDDGEADLVVVADRDRLDRGGLRALTAMLAGTRPAGPCPAPAVSRAARPAEGPAPDWGRGEPGSSGHGTHHLDLPPGPDGGPGRLTAALALTLSRYDGHGSTGIVTLAGSLGVAREIAVDPAATLADLTALCEAAPVPVDRPVTAGLLDVSGPQGPTGDDYLPFLAPLFPLTTTLVPLPDGGSRLWFSYRRSHFSPGAVEQFAGHLAHVYELSAHAPRTLVGDTDLLDSAERDRVARLGRPREDFAAEGISLLEAFRRAVSATPDAVAVSGGGVSLTYRDLDDRGTLLAAGLGAHGVRRGDRVGVCLERTVELVVTMLGVLKAGAAYVPTDPAYPADRLAWTASDAGLRVVVTRLSEFPRVDGTTALTPDELLEAAPTGPSAPAAAGPDDPAYVIYTSGSTGRPKGVVVPHGNVVSLVGATRDTYRLGTADVWTLFHSGAFDFSVWEIWGCLLTGGRLVVVPYFVSRDPEEFRDLLVAEQVTVLSQTPSAFSQLLRVDHAGLPVRLVVFGGEPLDSRMLLPWFDRHPEDTCRMVNMFGITETTVHVTAQTVTRELALAGSRSVGPALPGWHLYVTDAHGRPVPPGVTGEICVGGAGVATGYLGRPELTAQRFVTDPVTGGRMYRSGDLGRLLPDGRLEHLGRIDSQVKIRGFRIELDEIRSVLLEDPGVRAAAVVVRRDDPDDPAAARLDAYVVPAEGFADIPGIRGRSAGVLPGHMVPSTVTAVDALPLTTNGKLDTARLPVPSRSSAAPRQQATGPGAAAGLPEALLDIWATVLGTPVGLDDDFFELGGNSLFAVRVSAALRARDLPSLPLRDLYRTPTIRALTGGA
ncbi:MULTISPECIES: non-ribosomal peptide synthetase [unclassified Streptomyces]|uniref:non-ribosomal peptide synthetase n=1 Tax=unclassified Streptomyces TaxID=2593676 RepID=UPI002E0F8804|nr:MULTISPECIES: non-ribosomal peptide synthetase [unclassified Streptomyces]WSQ86503.1 non-ribosomal peptide synthetase [Streptomyces sp. NBC_01212]WSR07447.1 non-ribosomal peptide synthetase [Streptomyces sp. NBC_01208]